MIDTLHLSPLQRTFALLAAVKEAARQSGTPEGDALWYAADAFHTLLSNNYALTLPVEAIAARIAEPLGVRL